MLELFTALTVTAALVSAGLAGYVWWRRGTTAGLSLTVLLLAVAWWAFAYAVELRTVDLGPRERWGDLKYIGVSLLAPAWLVFVLHYTGRSRFVRAPLLLALAIEPLVILTALAMPATHDLVRFYPPSAAGEELPVVGVGPLFWIQLFYGHALVLIATTLFVASMVKLSRVYRVMAAMLVAAALLPWAANLLHNLEVGPFRRIDLTPFFFIFTGVLLVWGLYRAGLISLGSVAWRAVVDSTADGVILLDAFGRLVDANPAALEALGRSRARVIGLGLHELLPGHPELTESDAPPEQVEVAISVGGQSRQFQLRRQALPDLAGAPSGEILILHDISDQKANEQRLQQLLDERTRISEALQASLAPVDLPSIPGVDLACLYQPAGDGAEIGGDFFDVFPLGIDRWGIVLGDVSGKGAEAAVVTARVRYTLRALATPDASPSDVLRALNSVLLRDGTDERFCTLVYASARLGGRCLEMRVCLAGHHPPLLRGRAGAIRPVGAIGTALGLIAEPDLVDTSVALCPEETLCLFTDGLVEARRGRDEFGSERVAAVLSRDEDPRPQGVVDLLSTSVRDFHGGRLADDLALIALRVRPP